jgi:hypothetical protein
MDPQPSSLASPDEEGHNTRAYRRFHQPVEFASRLKVHLRGLIDQRIEAGEEQRVARWAEAPYRGLEVFDLRHVDEQTQGGARASLRPGLSCAGPLGLCGVVKAQDAGDRPPRHAERRCSR